MPLAVPRFAGAAFPDADFSVPRAAALPAAPRTAPFAVEPFAVEPDGFFGAALPLPAGVVPFAPAEPAPARGVDNGRAPEPRAEPEGRAGRREEGMR